MPIKRRGGGEKPLPKFSAPRVFTSSATKRAISKTPVKFAGRKKASKTSFSIKKRQPFSQYVFLDGNILVVRTPKECAKWKPEFSLLIVRDYVAPRTIKFGMKWEKSFIDKENQNTIYRIMGKDVHLRQGVEGLGTGQIVVLNTQIIDVQAKRVLYLQHDNPAMRILMVYAFLTDKNIGGVPTLDVAEWNS